MAVSTESKLEGRFLKIRCIELNDFNANPSTTSITATPTIFKTFKCATLMANAPPILWPMTTMGSSFVLIIVKTLIMSLFEQMFQKLQLTLKKWSEN